MAYQPKQNDPISRNLLIALVYYSAFQPVGHGPPLGHRAFCSGPQSILVKFVFGKSRARIFFSWR